MAWRQKGVKPIPGTMMAQFIDAESVTNEYIYTHMRDINYIYALLPHTTKFNEWDIFATGNTVNLYISILFSNNHC